MFCALIAYFPLVYFINWYLPKYSESLPIFRIIFAGLPISSAITVVIHNYYKVYDKSTYYFFKSVVILAISALANTIAYLVFGTTSSISVASIITIVIWFLYVQHYFVKNYSIPYLKNLLYALLLMFAFYLSTWIITPWMGGIIYMGCFFCATVAFYKTEFSTMKNLIKK